MKVLLQVLLFSLAPFFVYPWKPFINMFAGESYHVALKHFKDGHVGAVNLAGHFVCLIFCIFGNFGLLELLDQRIPQPLQNGRILSTLSAIIWIGILIPTKAPKVVTASSVAMIGLAYWYASLIPKVLFEQCAVGGFIIAIIGTNILYKSEKIELPFSEWVPKLLLAPGFYSASHLFSLSSYAGSQIDNASAIAIGTLCFLTALSATPNPIKKVEVAGVLLSRIAYILSGVEEFFYLSCGFESSLFQLICHLITNEEATLIAHGNKGGQHELALEYAHVIYFPNISLETIYDKFNQASQAKQKEY